MRAIFLALVSFLVVLSSCTDNKTGARPFVPDSVGNINVLQVVTPNDLWSGSVGEAIRDNFAAPADGLPQDEPLFSMNQMQPDTFGGFARSNRLFLYVVLSEEESVKLASNEFAKPQTGAIIKAPTEEALVELINSSANRIIQEFHKSEIKERQRRTSLSLLKTDSLKNVMGVSLKIPSAYRLSKASDSFFWFRKDLRDGETNILVYEAPLDYIKNDSTAIADIIKIRDSIGSKLLPVEDDALFVTEKAYAPFIFKKEIDGKLAYLTKGTWEVKGAYMGGPFINYAVKDEANNRYLILEGFSYAPAARKRDLQFELESILSGALVE